MGAQGGSAGEDASESEEAATPLSDATTEPEAAAAVCPEGSWGTVPDTNCHVIAQDCPLGQTCMPATTSGEPGTKCASLNNGLKTRADPCSMDKECAAGLKCVFGYCSPYCCKEAQFAICGPGGLCNVNQSVGGTGTYYVTMCSYLEPCVVWKQQCPTGKACHVISNDGSGACVPPPGGTFNPEGSACQFANDCGDNQICLSTCKYLCNRGGGPVDTPDAGPGTGACPSGQTCQALSSYPSWLGVCGT